MRDTIDKETVAVPSAEDTSASPTQEELPLVMAEIVGAAPPIKKKKKKFKKKLIIIPLVILLFVGGGLWFYSHRPSGKDAAGEVLSDTVQRGSITSMVEGNGMTKAKNSASIAIATAGTVQDVYVSEGTVVSAGAPLFLINSPTAQDAVKKAQKDVDGYAKQLKTLYEANTNLTVTVPHNGKLMEVADTQAGNTVAAEQVLAKVVDDSSMKLEQYYSYAYESNIYVGQTVNVSIPSIMQTLTGTITAVKKNTRISPEGSKLFCAVISINNPGTLTEKMIASAYTDSVYPYEPAELKYNQTTEIRAKVGGKLDLFKMENYQSVSAGTVVARISGIDTENDIFQAEQALATAKKELETTQKNVANLRATAPIAGTVIGLSIKPGQEIAANATVITISDTSSIVVEAKIDERNISLVTPGTTVEIDQWGQLSTGTVESVSLKGTFENGITTFPAIINVDNSMGTMMSGSSVIYRITASQSDDCLILPIQCVKSVASGEEGKNISVVFVQSETRPDNAVDVDPSSLGIPAGYFAVPVTTGISDKYKVEILDGVEEGTAVFTQIVQENTFGF